jgi:hypothetical protein
VSFAVNDRERAIFKQKIMAIGAAKWFNSRGIWLYPAG